MTVYLFLLVVVAECFKKEIELYILILSVSLSKVIQINY